MELGVPKYLQNNESLDLDKYHFLKAWLPY